MNNIPVTNGITMPIMVHTFVLVVVQRAIAPVSVKRSFEVHRGSSTVQRVRAPSRVRIAQRQRRITRADRAPRQPRARRVAARPSSPAGNADAPPGPGAGIQELVDALFTNHERGAVVGRGAR
jgi:hypothetical protein